MVNAIMPPLRLLRVGVHYHQHLLTSARQESTCYHKFTLFIHELFRCRLWSEEIRNIEWSIEMAVTVLDMFLFLVRITILTIPLVLVYFLHRMLCPKKGKYGE